MTTRTASSQTVGSTETLLSILEALEASGGARVTDLADEIDVADSTAHSHLSTLRANGYIVKEGDIYQLGGRFLRFGEYIRNRRDAYELAKPKVKILAEETGERCQFIVEEHGRGVYLHRETGSQAVLTDSGLGKRIHLHATAAGKALLAALPDERVEAVVDQWGFPELTTNTITDPNELREELTAVRERGYAINTEENTEGLHAIGVTIQDGNDEVIGAISISGPSHRMKGDLFEQDVPDRLLGTANELELNIRYS
jgi:DNA-binding IclR family transcriptional regulator